ncbi:signal recognition particle-docking protein FtsY [Goodfellowiella coeruleoviolacea]|uniref:Signal recognition particle receptor FtsY n=1 Tax=Goodfellowiella coeruleoviolacea TaxID=334858 RepID=A0AAE3GN49_9PSEU|nr:signal recognition particle-docking protein FtsY [Goodfellowiella coeruleoviolacea]MCP2170304.1 fused signal recognition particle receptor [Goodfellowiella coeruleoviolacea]
MSTTSVIWIVVAVVAVLAVAVVTGLVLARRRRISLTERKPTDQQQQPKGGGYRAGGGISLSSGGGTTTVPPPAHPAGERTETDGEPGVGEDAAVPRDSLRRGFVDVPLPPEAPATPEAAPAEPAPEAPLSSTDPALRETVAPGEPSPQSIGPIEDTATADTATADTTAPDTTAEDIAPPVVPPPAERTAPAAPVERPAAPVPAQPEAPGIEIVEPAVAEPAVEEIEPTAGRLERLRGRLARSRSTFGQGLLGLLGAGDLDEDSWTDIEDTLLMADLGAATTTEIVDKLRERLVSRGVRTSEQARAVLREVLVEALHPGMERSVRALPHGDPATGGKPAVVLVVGVNGTGKTTTTGKLARVLVADGRNVLLGAADTFRAAAADQLETWANRVGAEVVRGPEGADPASVAFDAVKRGMTTKVDTVLIDTAGRLHTKTGLMDELGKVKRVVEKQAEVDEVLLVLDATTGQNGLVQARVFAEVVDVTGIVLTKLDGTAKGGIVFQVQRELGVPVKLVGLGEGADHLAPFEPTAFVDALLG